MNMRGSGFHFAWFQPHSPQYFQLFSLPSSFVGIITMKVTTAPVLLRTLSAICFVRAAPVVDTMYPYTGPDVPVGDWVNPTVNGKGKGFPRLVEPPAVTPGSSNPTNNINVISLSYIPQGINIHYQTPFGLGVAPSVSWGTSAANLNQNASGSSHT
jgi:hypothetical protein